MSSWDAPTGNWHAGEEPEELSGPDQPTGGHRAQRGTEGPLRAGRRSLPGYEQGEAHDQAPDYDSGSSYGNGPGYGSEPGSGSGSGYQPGSGYGQPPVYEPVTGSGQQPSIGSGRQAPASP